ncbi:MAG TPA: hypothetical protein DER07_07480 [Armatimonadetes bacterium]|nr:hypothetical protein [Armatimonadota bacterium]
MGWRSVVVAGMGLMLGGRQDVQQPEPPPAFTDAERQAVVAFWNAPGRIEYDLPPQAATSGPWRVNLTVEGSKWLWAYNRMIAPGKLPPSQDPKAQNDRQAAWEAWIQAKVDYDRYLAAIDAERNNLSETGKTFGLVPDPAPAQPGPQPQELTDRLGPAPRFAEAVRPVQATVRFDDGTVLKLANHTPMRARYAYYRFPQGVMSGGTSVRTMPGSELDALFRRAGIPPKVQRVMQAVSLLEGGFDSINTYDTGYVSVGFIQFACLSSGAGSLGSMLLRYKTDSPEDFQKDFRAFGIDVLPDGRLAVVHPADGTEKRGLEAAMAIIEHPGLIAVFQRAGQRSDPYRIAQVRTAMAMFYPEDDVLSVPIGDRVETVRVGDIVRTEAGLATLMDRKVNTGKLDPLPQVLAQLAEEYGLESLREAADLEREIVAAMRYRRDYLASADLGQPEPPSRHKKSRSGQPPASRHKSPRKPAKR